MKVYVNFSGGQVFDIPPDQTAAQVAASCGITDPALYQEFAESDFDAACYLYPNAFSLSGGVVSFNLPIAKTQASSTVKSQYSTLESAATEGYSANQLASQSSLAEIDRLPDIQVVLDAVNVLAVELSTKLAAIAAATDINEINNIVSPPTGILSTGRGGQGDGPLDLNNSFYTEFNSASMTEAETELYIPGTDIVLNYGVVVPNGFTSNGNCFILGDYRVQIREVATGSVIASFECPLATVANVDVAF